MPRPGFDVYTGDRVPPMHDPYISGPVPGRGPSYGTFKYPTNADSSVRNCTKSVKWSMIEIVGITLLAAIPIALGIYMSYKFDPRQNQNGQDRGEVIKKIDFLDNENVQFTLTLYRDLLGLIGDKIDVFFDKPIDNSPITATLEYENQSVKMKGAYVRGQTFFGLHSYAMNRMAFTVVSEEKLGCRDGTKAWLIAKGDINLATNELVLLKICVANELGPRRQESCTVAVSYSLAE